MAWRRVISAGRSCAHSAASRTACSESSFDLGEVFRAHDGMVDDGANMEQVDFCLERTCEFFRESESAI